MSKSNVREKLEEYFSSMTPTSSRLMADIKTFKQEYNCNFEELDPDKQSEVLWKAIVKPEAVKMYENVPEDPINVEYFPVLRIRPGAKIIVEEDNVSTRSFGNSWRDEHSSPFRWETMSQLGLDDDEDDASETDEEIEQPNEKAEVDQQPPSVLEKSQVESTEKDVSSKIKAEIEQKIVKKEEKSEVKREEQIKAKKEEKAEPKKEEITMTEKEEEKVAKREEKSPMKRKENVESKKEEKIEAKKDEKVEVKREDHVEAKREEKIEIKKEEEVKKSATIKRPEVPPPPVPPHASPPLPPHKTVTSTPSPEKKKDDTPIYAKVMKRKSLPKTLGSTELKALRKHKEEAKPAVPPRMSLELKGSIDVTKYKTLPIDIDDIPKTGFDFLDNW